MIAKEFGGAQLAALGDRFLNLHEVRAKTGISPATIYRKIAKGTFPDRVPLTEKIVGWRLSEIDAWMQSPATYRQPTA